MSGHGHVTPNKNGSRARCGGPKVCHQCALEAAAKEHLEEGEVILAVALPPHTGNPLGGFTYEGELPNKDFIRENGPTDKWSQGEDDVISDAEPTDK